MDGVGWVEVSAGGKCSKVPGPMTHSSVPPEPRPKSSNGLLRFLAGLTARSPLMRPGRELWEKNQKDRNLPLSRGEKLWSGGYLILRDFADGNFPPVFLDERQTHVNEINYRINVPGAPEGEVARAEMLKPFWIGLGLDNCFRSFLKLVGALELAGLQPPAKLLELGGGAGWTAEFLAQLGFEVISTTIAPDDVKSGRKRAEALRVKGIAATLEFIAAPMESVAEQVGSYTPFDAVFVMAALHHAFDWRAAIVSSHACLRPGGWLLICDEPNVLHTAISYRVARLARTHEIGFNKWELMRHLRQTGFHNIISIGRRPHLFVRTHWLLAQK